MFVSMLWYCLHFPYWMMIKACENKIKEVYACKLALSDFWHWNYPIEKQQKVIHVLHFAWFNLFFNMGFQIAPYNLMLIVFFTQKKLYATNYHHVICWKTLLLVYAKRRYFFIVLYLWDMKHNELFLVEYPTL